ncbi:hypothetical protein [Spiroplasma endosymbiont of Melieria omissa]|uniref:hypothetical protein n=1 Tax=Spiroplasma endosymbiont of Melieria omissa TaxID=3139324 RepID=UPI003CCAAF9B
MELQSLENLIALIKQKSEIELEIERLEKNKEQLTTNIDANNGQIQFILNDNESSKEQLITKIDEINLNIKTLNDNIFMFYQREKVKELLKKNLLNL